MLSQFLIPLLGVVLMAASIAPVWLGQRTDSKKKPALEGLNPAWIDMSLGLEQAATITNPEPLMSLLRTGRAVRQHRCSYAGQFTLRFTNGTSARVLFRPGHTNDNYEFTWTNGLFAVPRSNFMATLALAGVNTNEIPTK
jgi:hypothetical protein